MRLTTADLKRYRRLRFMTTPRGMALRDDAAPGDLKTPPAPELTPGVVERNRATLELIEAFIRTLPDEYTRQIVLLKYADGLTWFQIAQRFGGTTPEALQQHVYAQLRKFNEKK